MVSLVPTPRAPPGERGWGLGTRLSHGSLVPRLPRSGTRTLKLCRRGRGESGNEARVMADPRACHVIFGPPPPERLFKILCEINYSP